MSVWPHTISSTVPLVGTEGALVSVSIYVAPRLLELLLDTLAQLDFPVNPQIYHDAALVYYYEDGSERTEPTTLVEFPAYADHLEGLRSALACCGFDPASVAVSSMLDALHSEAGLEAAPKGADYRALRRRKVSGLNRASGLQ